MGRTAPARCGNRDTPAEMPPAQPSAVPAHAIHPPPRLAVIGFGNMGAAVVTGALASRVLEPSEVLVVETNAAKRNEAGRFGCRTSDDPRAAGSARDVLLAVKPQSFPDLAPQLAVRAGRTVFVSVMAGLSGERILAAIGGTASSTHAVVRAMPNTPCKLGVPR